MSVFIGDTLQHVLEDFENQTSTGKKGSKTSINIPNIPEILLDNTDRNRTSPFAFTGNKFEFRAVGSSDNCASPMVVLNTIVANQLMKFKTKVDALIAKGKDKETALREVLRKDLTSCKKVIFGGNGYSDEWVVEAKKRGLKIIRHSAEALAAYMSKASVELFTNLGIFSHKELEARTEIRYESFCLTIELESKVLTEMIQNMVIPSAIRYQSRIADNVSKLLNIGLTKDQVSAQIDLLTQLSSLINSAQALNNKLSAEVDKAMEKEHAKDRALALNSKVKPLFEEIRAVSDEIERLCDDSDWALPKYRELITLN
jgi:glutamine synthetase